MEYEIIPGSGEIPAEHLLKFGSGKHYAVRVDGRDHLRVEVDDDEWNPFNDGIIWRGYFCLGTGSEIIAVDLETLEYKRYSVDWYFGRFLEYEEILFAASAAGVLVFDKNMDLLWRNEGLAVDGVTFGGVSGNVLEISCELDPPGGRVKKRLDIQTGKEL